MRPRCLLASTLAVAISAIASCATGDKASTTMSEDGGEGASGSAGGPAGSGGTAGMGGGPGSGGETSCAESPCKVVPPQCGCAADQQCTVGDPTAENPNGRFCDAAGTTDVGDACSATSKCAEGAMCVNAGGVSTCLEFCANDTSCDAPGGVCIVTLEDSGGRPIPDATLCSTNCDPVTNTGCDIDGSSCNVGKDTASGKAFSICVAAGAGMQGATCTTQSDCAPTFGCFNNMTGKQCLRYCGYSPASGTCPTPTVCTPFTEKVILGMQEYGACL